MYVVAIRELPPAWETLTPALAPVVGSAPVVLAARFRAAGKGPFVVGISGEAAAAAAQAAAVAAAGFPSLVLEPGKTEADAARFLVRSPSFRNDLLCVESRGGEILTIDLASVTLILRGTMGVAAIETTTTSERKFSPGRALLTGGMMLTKTVKTTAWQATDTREGFAHVYAAGLPPVVLRESALTYEDFGVLRQPSRSANFAALVGELRRRCTAAAFDDRLLTRAGQARLLGPALSPEEHLDAAVTLLAVTRR